MKLELFYPLKPFQTTQKFGENLNGFYRELGMLGHNGIDMVGTTGQTIYAAHDGVVTFTGEDGSGGLGVVVRTTELFEWNGEFHNFKSIYWHCLPNSFKVKPGDIVKAGTPLAQCDSTGKVTGPHLHFGIKPMLQGDSDYEWIPSVLENGYKGAIDPQPFFNGYYAVDAQVVQKILATLKELLQKAISLFTK